MKTLSTIVLAVFILFSFTSCYVSMSVTGSKNIVEEIREVSEFSKLNIDGVCDVEIVYGEQGEIEVNANDNIIDQVITEVENGTLSIDLKDGNFTNVQIEVKIYTTNLDFISKDGVGSLDMDDMDGLDELEINHDGVGNIKMSGSANKFIYIHDGVGQLNAFSFEAVEVEIKQDGVGSSEVYAAERLEGSLNGVGNIKYKGDPVVDVDENGVGSVKDAN